MKLTLVILTALALAPAALADSKKKPAVHSAPAAHESSGSSDRNARPLRGGARPPPSPLGAFAWAAQCPSERPRLR